MKILRSKKGFTLVEIMIVVAIIGLLAAIAIPNILRARLNANEGAAIANLRTLATAAESYRAVQTPVQYPAALDDLSTATPPYVRAGFTEGGLVQGYRYNIVISGTAPADTMIVSCYPETRGVSGNRSFLIDSSGVIMSDAASHAAEITATTGFSAMN